MRTETMQYQEGLQPPAAVPWEVPLFFSVFVLFVFFGVALNKRKKQVFEGLTTFLQGTVTGAAFIGVFKFNGTYSGRPLRIKRTPPGRNTPGWLELSLGDPPYIFDLRLSEEGFLTGALKSVGLAKDIEAGDPAFDERLRAVSDTPELAREWLADAGRRDLVISIFNAGAYELQFVPRGVTIGGLLKVRFRDPDLEERLAMHNLTPLLEAMSRLCSEENGAAFFGPGGRTGFSGRARG